MQWWSVMAASAVAAAAAVVAAAVCRAQSHARRSTRPPRELEPHPGTAQCNYETLRALASLAEREKLRYSLAAGTLLGAMRNDPPGLLKWEHDVDVYMPAKDVWRLLELLRAGACERTKACAALDFRGHVDRLGRPCCGFGVKLFHKRSSACELDVLVLAPSHSRWLYGDTWLWPPGAAWVAPAVAWAASHFGSGAAYFVIPEDVSNKTLMAQRSRWCVRGAGAEWEWCGGPPVSFFSDEYFAASELFPLSTVRMYDFEASVAREPWGLLNRTYGRRCGRVARLDEHGGIEVDLREEANRHLLEAATVSLVGD